MKFTCDRRTLLEAIVPATLAVNNKSTIASLEGLLFSAEDGTLTVTGYDLEKAIRVTVPAEVRTAGKAVINALRVTSIIRSLPESKVSFETDEKYLTKISCEASVFEIHCSSGESYPILPEIDDAKAFTLGRKPLRKMLSQTLFAAAVNDLKPTLNGALFELKEGALRIVALDGFRLAYRCNYEIMDESSGEDLSFIVPGRTLSELSKLLGDIGGDVKIELARKVIVFTLDNLIFTSRLIEGEFYDYRRSLEQIINTHVVIDRAAFTEVVERCMLVVDEKNKAPIRLNFTPEALKTSCVSGIGKVFDEVPIEMEGEGLEIGFTGRLLLDVLHNIDEEKIMLNLSSPIKSMQIIPTADYDRSKGDYVYLALPMRLMTSGNE